MKDLFVTGTDTGVGKTVLSAVLAAALDRAYWKPIQTGRAEGDCDREAVIRWAGLGPGQAPPEAFVFDPPVSPHLAAREAGVRIDLAQIVRPDVGARDLVIEGAGGVMVPINEVSLMLDLADHLEARVVVASRTALGTINHTLLTVERIRAFGLNLLGVVMIGPENSENRDAIEHYGQVPVVGWIPVLDRIDRPALLGAFEQHFDKGIFHGL